MRKLGILCVCAVLASCAQTGVRSRSNVGMTGRAVSLEAAAFELWAQKPPAKPAAGTAKPAATDKAQPADAPASPSASPSASPAEPAPLKQRLVVYQARLSVGVFEPEKSAMELIAAVEKAGGYLKSRTNNQLLLRVPAALFMQFTQDVESVGIVSSRIISSQDITSAWVDATLRLNNQLATRSRLQAILAGARNVTETLAVEREINRVSSEVEQLKGRLRLFGNQVDFAFVQVDFFLRHGPASITPSPVKIDTPIRWIKRFDIVTLFRD